MRANSKDDVDTVLPGNICALVGLKNVSTGDTLLSNPSDFVLEPPVFPEPVISMFIEPKTKCDQEKLSLSLKKLSEEDPTFKVNYNDETGQTLISGMGELHLEIIKDRLIRDFKINAVSGQPQIAYKESITKASRGEGKYIKQSGGRGQYGHVIIEIKPKDRGAGINILNKVVGGSIPREFIKPIISGLTDSLKGGFLEGYPIIDLDIYIKDGSFHEVDSSEYAFKMAASLALKDALSKADVILLEPIMRVDVTTPEEYQGDIINDIIKKRGVVDKVLFEEKFITVQAFIALKEMFGYSTHIRSLSKGRASYSMTPSHFEKVQNL
jgi:elongation factor G